MNPAVFGVVVVVYIPRWVDLIIFDTKFINPKAPDLHSKMGGFNRFSKRGCGSIKINLHSKMGGFNHSCIKLINTVVVVFTFQDGWI